MVRLTIAACLAATLATPALALQPLHENKTVVEGFYNLGMADTIRKRCDTISPRLLTAYTYLKSLERYARDLGYTDADIDALVDNDAEKEKLRARIARDLAARGATPETPEGYCAVGREEIAKGSEAGKLLRAR